MTIVTGTGYSLLETTLRQFERAAEQLGLDAAARDLLRQPVRQFHFTIPVRMDDGRELTLNPGDLFAIAPGHDSWVVGDASYISLHFEGAEAYARK